MKLTERNMTILKNKISRLEVELERAKDEFYAEGNNGGCYVKLNRIKQNNTQEELVRVENGDHCVVTANHVIPVTLLSQMITFAMDNREQFEQQAAKYSDKEFGQFLLDNFVSYSEYENKRWLEDMENA